MKKEFNPLIFLMSLGAGGIAIIPFAFFQYTIEHGAGLIKMSDMLYTTLSQQILFHSLEGVMIVFSLLHIVLSLALVKGLVQFVRSEKYKDYISDPLKNMGILAPFISLVMTMNVFIGPIRYFWPWMSTNLQSFMLPALIFWIIIWYFLVKMEIKLLRIAFTNTFDVDKISFGWLLHPFALGMLTVTGTGIAAMAKTPWIAHTAAFMSAVSGSMGIFLLIVKMIAIFKSHYNAKGLPAKQFMPSFLIVIPNITLYAISAFRLGHYLENQHGMHMGAYFLIVMTTAFAFETWYALFGLALLRDYLKKDFFQKEFYVSQWGFVCPVVAYAVLGSFVFKVFVPSLVLYYVIVLTLAVAVVLFFTLLRRQCKCSGLTKSKDMQCV